MAENPNWLTEQLEAARKDYETWPEWMKACSRTRLYELGLLEQEEARECFGNKGL